MTAQTNEKCFPSQVKSKSGALEAAPEKEANTEENLISREARAEVPHAVREPWAWLHLQETSGLP